MTGGKIFAKTLGPNLHICVKQNHGSQIIYNIPFVFVLSKQPHNSLPHRICYKHILLLFGENSYQQEPEKI